MSHYTKMSHYTDTHVVQCLYFNLTTLIGWLQMIIISFEERLFGRQEESLHESLQEAMAKILPTMVPFLNTSNLKVWPAVVL